MLWPNSLNAKRIEERIQAVPAAKPLTTDAAILEPACALVSARAGMLRPLHKALQRLDQQRRRQDESGDFLGGGLHGVALEDLAFAQTGPR